VGNTKQFNSFAEFYPYYLKEHGNSTCRRLHFIGTTLVIGLLAYVLGKGALGLLIAVPIAGYGFAWVGTSSSKRTAQRPSSIRSTACSGIS